ncbi:hypothetical protein [Nocardioides daphniae]|nr:hypothetical protein [Nocardioides daphniae]
MRPGVVKGDDLRASLFVSTVTRVRTRMTHTVLRLDPDHGALERER